MILSSPAGLSYSPKRIISLVPSQTELLFTLGLEKETVGITKFCVHPHQWFTTKTRVGGTKTINKAVIDQLKPDLIIANKEENVKEQVEELAKGYPVYVTDVNDLDSALQMISDVGTLTHTIDKAEKITTQIKDSFTSMKQELNTQHSKLNTCYLIWRNPYMTVGGDTFINDMLNKCGFQNIFADQTRYPEIDIDRLKIECQLLLLSSEPYPFKQKHIDELQKQLPACKIILVDGEMFSWYGSRMLHAADYFTDLIKRMGTYSA